ncbi:hypothetical protein B0H11DRAFT_2385000 [Mycena galericulata]|nr:hypothetical protein B0H11DRAFT_2385000 [Mycena galericulata]
MGEEPKRGILLYPCSLPLTSGQLLAIIRPPPVPPVPPELRSLTGASGLAFALLVLLLVPPVVVLYTGLPAGQGSRSPFTPCGVAITRIQPGPSVGPPVPPVLAGPPAPPALPGPSSPAREHIDNRGKTNIPFLFRLLTHDVFIGGKTWTTFIDDTPELFKLVQSQNRAQKLLAYLGDLAVNGSSIKGQVGEPGLKDEVVISQFQNREDPINGPPLDASLPCEVGWRNIIVEHGPEAFAKAVREYPGTLIMDTTWRDAHQSLLATRLRTIDMVNIAKETSYALANAYSLECWGGATFDVAMRFLYEDPWERLRTLRKLVPNIPLQALNYFGMKLGIDAAKKAGGYYLDFVDQLVSEGIHVLGVKDMAGLLKPEAAKMLIGAIRKAHPDLPIHVHSHDTAGIAAASMIACAAAGADVVDVAIDSMSGLTSQPSMVAVCMALEQTSLGTGIRFEDIQALNIYWSQVRLLYTCFEANVRASDSSVFDHEMPGGQYTNLMFQAAQLGLGTQWIVLCSRTTLAVIKQKYIEANKLCGNIIKVTPSSKVVGDFAQWMTSNSFSKEQVIERAEQLDFPSSVVEFFQGYLGQPVGGFPEPLRTRIIRNKPRIDGRPGATMAPCSARQIYASVSTRTTRRIDRVSASCTQGGQTSVADNARMTAARTPDKLKVCVSADVSACATCLGALDSPESRVFPVPDSHRGGDAACARAGVPDEPELHAIDR